MLVNHFGIIKKLYFLPKKYDDPIINKIQSLGYSDEVIQSEIKGGIKLVMYGEIFPEEELPLPEGHLERYAFFMSEIERRFKVIQDIYCNAPFQINYIKINSEIIASQIRKILEFFAISFLSIDDKKRPVPSQSIGSLLNSNISVICDNNKIKEKIKDTYDKCNRILHAENIFKKERKQKAGDFYLHFRDVFSLLENLIECHSVLNPENGHIFLKYYDNKREKCVAKGKISKKSKKLYTTISQIIKIKSLETKDEYFYGSQNDKKTLEKIINSINNKNSKIP